MKGQELMKNPKFIRKKAVMSQTTEKNRIFLDQSTAIQAMIKSLGT